MPNQKKLFVKCEKHGEQEAYILCIHLIRNETISWIRPDEKYKILVCIKFCARNFHPENFYPVCEVCLKEDIWNPEKLDKMDKK
jgi:hypothetical protein